jgi:hypothetical protein
VPTEVEGLVNSADLTKNPPVLSVAGQDFTLDKVQDFTLDKVKRVVRHYGGSNRRSFPRKRESSTNRTDLNSRPKRGNFRGNISFIS